MQPTPKSLPLTLPHRDLLALPVATDSNTVAKTYTWGLDLSQSLQGAGGVGGLLAVADLGSQTSDVYYATYDANGNISEYVDDSDSVVAHYEYSPFGKLTSSSGSKASDFNHRFSTKYHDSETALYYYGYRYYSSELGRWISRDPIQEEGGLNLYGFIVNSTVDQVDLLGQTWWNPFSGNDGKEYCREVGGEWSNQSCCCKDKEFNPEEKCCKNGDILSHNQESPGVKMCFQRWMILVLQDHGIPIYKSEKVGMTLQWDGLVHHTQKSQFRTVIRETQDGIAIICPG